MAKIKTLKINNFKFFGREKPVEVDSCHLLVYGENGSGKSTLYWSLYTLLEAASKTQPENINKYFRRGPLEVDSLVNIHAPQNSNGEYDSFVEVALDNNRTYRIAYNHTDIIKDNDAKRSNATSDFLNYRLIYKTYDFAHSEVNDLYPLFEREILPYTAFRGLKIDEERTETKAFNIISYLLQHGPGKTLNPKGDEILAPKHSEAYKTFEANLRQFNDDLSNLLDTINLRGNQILKQDFGYLNFEFKLELTQNAHIDKKDKWFKPYHPKIELKIPQYNGIVGIIHKPQSFLNEARLSALSLAIRLAVLEKNQDPGAELRLLVLDDLLLSLDMSNRDCVLDLLLNRYVNDYQIILMTHEFRFFEIAKKRIEHKGQSAGWLFYEMYAGERENQPCPIIKPSDTYLGKAKRNFQEHDYAAAGNFLRKEAEFFCKKLLPKRLRTSKEGGEIELNGMINKALEFANVNNLHRETQEYLKHLDEHRKFIFNPLSHDSFDVSMLKNDMKRAFNTLDYLTSIKIQTLLQMGDKLSFELSDPAGDLHRFEVQVCDELKLITEKEGTEPILAKCPCESIHYKNGQKSPNPVKLNDLKSFFKSKYDQSNLSQSADYSETILLENGQPLKSIF